MTTTVARGFVYEDAPQTGRYEPSKKGIARAIVSNMRTCVLTDERGYYEIPMENESVIFVVQPSGYAVPLGANGLPKFYYLHYPEGSPPELALPYGGILPTGTPPRWLNFGLLPAAAPPDARFRALVVGDPQAKTTQHVRYYRDQVVRRMLSYRADFLLSLGDMVWDTLDLFAAMQAVNGLLNLPVWHICGNHDLDLHAPNRHYATQTFRQHYGPDYYAFQHGRAHFLVLNNVAYQGWNAQEQRPGAYIGNLDAVQLEWARSYLALIPKDDLVVVASHIALFTQALCDRPSRNTDNRDALFELLSPFPNLFALSGHTHYLEHTCLSPALGGWRGAQSFRALVVGAGCGAWWFGALDAEGFPETTGVDGTPRGFFRFDFEGNSCMPHYITAQRGANHQLEVRQPVGTTDLPTSAADRLLVVNIFNAMPDAQVRYSLNGQAWQTMTRTYTTDAHFERVLAQNRSAYPDWMQARAAAHIWSAQLPDALGAGMYRLQIVALQPDGKTRLDGFHTFEWKTPPL